MNRLGSFRFFLPLVTYFLVFLSPVVMLAEGKLLEVKTFEDLLNLNTVFMLNLVLLCGMLALMDKVLDQHYLAALTLASMFSVLYTGRLMLFGIIWIVLMCASGIKIEYEERKEFKRRFGI